MADSEQQPKSDGAAEPEPDADELLESERPLAEILGIELHFAPEDLAPPVDEQRLGAFVRQELTGDDRDEILDLIAGFRSWYDALGKILREQGDRQDVD